MEPTMRRHLVLLAVPLAARATQAAAPVAEQKPRTALPCTPGLAPADYPRAGRGKAAPSIE